MKHELKKQLGFLTILRGPAALFVFAFYILHNTQWASWLPVANIGYSGVSIFFVLSGFVLTWSFNPERSYKNFFVRRIARIYPLRVLMFCVALLIPVTAYPFEILPALSNLFLLQAWVPAWNYIFSVNAVSWSLSNELFFYLLTPLVLTWLNQPTRDRLIKYGTLGGLWLGITIIALSIAHTSNFADVVVYSHPVARLGQFILGIMAAKFSIWFSHTLHKQVSGLYVLVPLVLFLLALLFLSHASMSQTATSIVLAPFSALLLVFLAIYENKTVRKYDNWWLRALVFAGEASFAFYLVHELVIINLAHIIGSNHSGVTGATAMVMSFIVSAILAALAHVYFERPCQRKIVKWVSVREGTRK